MLDGIDPKLLGQTLEIPGITLRFGSVQFHWSHAEDGESGIIAFTFPHPMLPLRIEVPFDRLFYMEDFLEKTKRWIESAKETSEASP